MASQRKSRLGSETKRSRPSRDIPDRVLIVTEGTKTEPDYFHLLVCELELTTVKIFPAKGSAPINIIEEAKARLSKDKDFEQVYCVFDQDHHQTYADALDKLSELKKKYKSKTLCAITSIPCFELWYLLHVSNSRKPYTNADDLIVNLKKKSPFENYQKNDCDRFFGKIRERRKDALARAKRFLNQAKKDGLPEFHENPSTRVHLVVEALTAIANPL